MLATHLEIAGVWLLDISPHTDERGFFARTMCAEEFSTKGLPQNYPQSSISFNHARGTLRGMHLQVAPSKEAKLVRCTRGAIFDVVLDLRRSSPTFGRSLSVELSAENRRSLAIPEGCAHGFITLQDASEVLYMMSEPQQAQLARGVRWNDPIFGIPWPFSPVVISERDATYPDFTEELLKA
jgi:dTDP-4-dehydrorhamnose 3,5-epimerase